MKRLIGMICFVASLVTLSAQSNILFTRLVSFDGTNGALPYAGLILARDGDFYGTTARGGSYNKGSIFKVTTMGKLTMLFSFDGTNGSSPFTGLVQGRDGFLYGVCSIAGVYRIAPDGSGFTSLHRFLEENKPTQGLTLGADGNLYGFTPYGGVGNNGAIFRITPKGEFQIVLSCNSQSGYGCGELIVGRDGNLYGTMAGGGAFSNGNFFRLTTNGLFTILSSFSGTNFVRVSRNRLLEGDDGNFYGTTEFGGESDNVRVGDDRVDIGDGTVFMVNTNGVTKTLASFKGWNGSHPRGGLIQTSDGNLYGVTAYENSYYSNGTIFKATTNGEITMLYSFKMPTYEYSMTNGAAPCGIIRHPNGDFYGVTIFGGEKAYMAGYASGTIFKFHINPELGQKINR